MEIETWWQRLGCIRNPGAHSGEESARDDEIAELRGAIESREQEVLKLHRDLAAEKLRADQGWHRYEAANLRKNELEAERANWVQEIAALKSIVDERAESGEVGPLDQDWRVDAIETFFAEECEDDGSCHRHMARAIVARLRGWVDEGVTGIAGVDSQPAIQAQDPIRELIALHAQELDQNDYAYFELARTRRTDWMAWICTNLVDNDPGRKVLATGQGDTPEEACSNAIMDYAERAKD